LADSEMTSDMKRLLKDANDIWDEGRHVAKAQKQMNPIEFHLHLTKCGRCFKFLLRTDVLKEYKEYGQWSHDNPEVQCEKFGHTKWIVENLNILN
jgi:hypothetical protein